MARSLLFVALPLLSAAGSSSSPSSLSPSTTHISRTISPSSSSSPPFCGVVENNTGTPRHTFATIDPASGAIHTLLPLPTLDSYGGGISAGATPSGLYFTVTGNVSEQEDIFVASLPNRTSSLLPITLPDEFSFLSLYGVGSLSVIPQTSLPLAMMLGYANDGMRYSFLATIDPSTGNTLSILTNLTSAYRTWDYLYAGVTAYDPSAGLYFLCAVKGSHEYTTLFAFNTTFPPGIDGSGTPFIDVPYVGLGDFMGLALSPALAQKFGGGSTGLVALVDDDDNTGAGIWLLLGNQTWAKLYQYAPNTLESSGFNNFELSADGLTAYSVFYDNHTPVANQIISAVDLVKGKEVARTIVGGGNFYAAIEDLASCATPA